MSEQTTPEAPAPAPSETDAIVDQWFVEHFHNRGHDAPAFNFFQAARDALKARLRK